MRAVQDKIQSSHYTAMHMHINHLLYSHMHISYDVINQYVAETIKTISVIMKVLLLRIQSAGLLQYTSEGITPLLVEDGGYTYAIRFFCEKFWHTDIYSESHFALSQVELIYQWPLDYSLVPVENWTDGSN